MKNSRSYKIEGLIVGFGIGAVLFVGYVFYCFSTFDSESLGYFKLGVPLVAIEFALPSVVLGTLVGWIYGKIKSQKQTDTTTN